MRKVYSFIVCYQAIDTKRWVPIAAFNFGYLAQEYYDFYKGKYARENWKCAIITFVTEVS